MKKKDKRRVNTGSAFNDVRAKFRWREDREMTSDQEIAEERFSPIKEVRHWLEMGPAGHSNVNNFEGSRDNIDKKSLSPISHFVNNVGKDTPLTGDQYERFHFKTWSAAGQQFTRTSSVWATTKFKPDQLTILGFGFFPFRPRKFSVKNMPTTTQLVCVHNLYSLIKDYVTICSDLVNYAAGWSTVGKNNIHQPKFLICSLFK